MSTRKDSCGSGGTTFDPQKGNLSTRTNSLFGHKEDFKYDNQDRLTTTTTESAFINQTNADNNITGYETENGATTSYSGATLVTQAAVAGATLKKTLLTGATIGDKISINLTAYKVGGSDTFNIYIQEVGAASALYFKKELTSRTGTNTFEHIVTQYTTLVLRIEKVNTTTNNVFVVNGLTASKISQTTQAYDDRGRITQNELGTYNYANNDKKHQNTSVTLAPDAKAYYQATPLQTVSYNVFKSPVEIVVAGVDKMSFVYNDNNSRSVMFYGSLDDNKTLRPNRKYYSADGSMEIKHNISTGVTEFVTYLGGDGYSAPVVYKKNYNSAGAITNEQMLYLHRDYQGSILAITNDTGAIVEKRQFDAWGAILKVQDGAGNVLNGLTILDRGYTGHEHLQSVGLINMNGRLYDPKLHRFLQPDNFVQDPSNTQNYNRYGYCYNNPLKYTDVTGEWFGLDDLVVAAASFVIGYVGSGLATGNWGWSSVKTGLITAVTGWLAYNTAGASTGITAGSGSLNAAMGNFIVNQAASVAISYFIPPVGIQVGDWSISISPSIAFGNSMGIGANLSVTYSSGDFSFSGGIGIMSNSNYNGLGKNGMEIRKSILIAYDDGKTGFSLGTNFWSGTGGMNEFSQQTGTLGLHFGDFRAQYENDGKPFSGINADGNDQYRTAALTLSVGEYSAGFNLFSGSRTRKDYEIEKGMSGGELGTSSNGRYGEHYKNGFVHETGPAYRMGAAYFGYKGYRAGVNSNWVSHAIQNVAIHGTFIANQRMFPMMSGNVKPYFNYQTSNGFSSW